MAHSDSLHFNVIDIAYCSSLWLILVHCSLLLLICITTFDNVFVTKDVHMLSLQVCAYSVSPDIIEKINQNLLHFDCWLDQKELILQKSQNFNCQIFEDL